MRTLLPILLTLIPILLGCSPHQEKSGAEPSRSTAVEKPSTESQDPLSEKLKSVASSDIASISFVMAKSGDLLFEIEPPKKGIDIDVTREKDLVLPLLKKSRLVNSGSIGVGMWPIGAFELKTKSGDTIQVDLYPFGFFMNHPSSTEGDSIVYVYDSELKHFWNALKYDVSNRVYSEQAYRDLLLRYAKSEGGKPDAFAELVRSFKDSRAIPLIPKYLENSGNLLFALKSLGSIDDRPAIDAVCQHLYSSDLSTARFAADVLNSWGQLPELHRRAFSPTDDDFKKSNRGTAYFCTHMACWFAEHGRYSDAVKTIRINGIEKFQLTSAYCLLRPLHQPDGMPLGPRYSKPTETERLDIFLLMADFIEQRSEKMFVMFLRNLWDAMGVQYDIDSNRLVQRNEDSEPFFRDEHTGKMAANAIRDWVRKQQNK